MPSRTLTWKQTKAKVKLEEPAPSIQSPRASPRASPRSAGEKYPSRRGSDYVLRQLLDDQHEQSSLQSILRGVTRTLACEECLMQDVGLLPLKDLKNMIITAGLSTDGCIEMSEIRERAKEAQKLLVRKKKLREPTTPGKERRWRELGIDCSSGKSVTGRSDESPDSAPTSDEPRSPRTPRTPRTPTTPTTPRARPASASLAAQADRVVGALGTAPALAGLGGSCSELQASAAGLRADVAAASSNKSSADTNKALRHALQLLESLTSALQEKGVAEAAAAADAAAEEAKAAEAAEAEAAAEAERARVEAEAAAEAEAEAEQARKAAAEAAAAAKAVTPLPLLQALMRKQQGAASDFPAPLPLPPLHMMRQMQRHQQRMREGDWVSPRLAKQQQQQQQQQPPPPQQQQQQDLTSTSGKRKSLDGCGKRRSSTSSNGPCEFESQTPDECRPSLTRDVSVSFTVQASSAEL